MPNIFFNAAHSPIGAGASFTLGFLGASGGLGLELGRPADQNVYIGLQTPEGNRFEALPFFESAEGDPLAPEAEGAGETATRNSILVGFPLDQIRREFSAATDTWQVGDLSFRLISPVLPIPNPETASPDELRRVLLPVVFAEIRVDNRQGTIPRIAFLGYQGTDPYVGMRRLDIRGGAGIAQGGLTAIVLCQPGGRAAIGFTMSDILAATPAAQAQFGLGQTAALLVTAPPGVISTFRFALCFYRAGVATSGLKASYLYTRLFPDIEAVATYAGEHAAELIPRWDSSDAFIRNSDLSPARHFMLCQAVRSYYASTQLFIHDDRPLWVVQEGEYRMINTLDLVVDHLFFELRMNPWTVRNVLELYLERYAYFDSVRLPDSAETYPGGLGFCHDMGVANVFAPAGHSAYELPDRSGIYSYMTCEELLNWVCCAAMYALKTCDFEWARQRLAVFEACLDSLLQRDHPVPEQRDGMVDCDSDRAGSGTEITTYDSLDASLGPVWRNTYLAVKTWAAYLLLDVIFRREGSPDLVEAARQGADRVVATIGSYILADGLIPAILDGKSRARIIPTIEGLVFPHVAGINGEAAALGPSLRRHLEGVLHQGICLFPDGGWKLSSTSDNSWLSKIYLCQFVATEILGLSQEFVQSADVAHAAWLLDEDNAYWCWSDQMVAGKARGSRFYPRGVTAILWLGNQSPVE